MQNDDDNQHIALWLIFGVVAVTVLSTIGGVVWRQVKLNHAAAMPAATSPAETTMPAADTMSQGHASEHATAGDASSAADESMVDVPNDGELAATLYFAVGSAALTDDGQTAIAKAAETLNAAPEKKVVLSGFHDPSGDAARNAELAKQRAFAARDALTAAGIDAERIVLRKPESTTGDGPADEARRVELRLVD